MLETVNLTELANMLRVSRPTAYNIVNSPGFPKPIPPRPSAGNGKAARRWRVVDVEQWMAGREG